MFRVLGDEAGSVSQEFSSSSSSPSPCHALWTRLETWQFQGWGEVGLEEHRLGTSSEASPFWPSTVGAG